jgi:hypothetical protein
MKVGILRARVLHTDDTGVKLLGTAAGETTQAHLWVYMGDPSYPYNVFDRRQLPFPLSDNYLSPPKPSV